MPQIRGGFEMLRFHRARVRLGLGSDDAEWDDGFRLRALRTPPDECETVTKLMPSAKADSACSTCAFPALPWPGFYIPPLRS
jgi:hypothetical protein